MLAVNGTYLRTDEISERNPFKPAGGGNIGLTCQTGKTSLYYYNLLAECALIILFILGCIIQIPKGNNNINKNSER